MHEKEAFHFGKLSLFNVRLLSDLEQARASMAEIKTVVNARIAKDNLRTPLSLVHQATFIGHAYVVLVWLRESLWKVFNDLQKETVRKEFGERFNCRTDVTKATASDPKELNLVKPRDVWWLMRNAISHARITISDEGLWTFSNDHPDEPQKHGSLVLTMTQLGTMCDAALFAYQAVVDPKR